MEVSLTGSFTGRGTGILNLNNLVVLRITKYSKTTHDALDVLVLAVDLLHPEDVVAKVEAFEPPLLPEERDDGAAGPVHALAEHLLDVELVLADGDAVHELRKAKKLIIQFTTCIYENAF